MYLCTRKGFEDKYIMAKKNEIAKAEVAAIQSVEQIESLILTIRGKQVILDRDLARLYGVETKVLNQAVKRNIERFPEDFMFQLSRNEIDSVKSQFVTLQNLNLFEGQDGGRRKLSYAFTEQGVYMLATVLRGELARQQSIFIMRTFREIRDIQNSIKDYMPQGFESIVENLQYTDDNDLDIHDYLEETEELDNEI